MVGSAHLTTEIKVKIDQNQIMEIRSPAFFIGATIPFKYTCDGDNLSPPLQWEAPPPGTKSFALIVDDIDAPNKYLLTGLYIICRLKLVKFRKEFVMILNYHQLVDLPLGATKEQLTKAMEGHILDTPEVMGRYEREI